MSRAKGSADDRRREREEQQALLLQILEKKIVDFLYEEGPQSITTIARYVGHGEDYTGKVLAMLSLEGAVVSYRRGWPSHWFWRVLEEEEKETGIIQYDDPNARRRRIHRNRRYARAAE